MQISDYDLTHRNVLAAINQGRNGFSDKTPYTAEQANADLNFTDAEDPRILWCQRDALFRNIATADQALDALVHDTDTGERRWLNEADIAIARLQYSRICPSEHPQFLDILFLASFHRRIGEMNVRGRDGYAYSVMLSQFRHRYFGDLQCCSHIAAIFETTTETSVQDLLFLINDMDRGGNELGLPEEQTQSLRRYAILRSIDLFTAIDSQGRSVKPLGVGTNSKDSPAINARNEHEIISWSKIFELAQQTLSEEQQAQVKQAVARKIKWDLARMPQNLPVMAEQYIKHAAIRFLIAAGITPQERNEIYRNIPRFFSQPDLGECEGYDRFVWHQIDREFWAIEDASKR